MTIDFRRIEQLLCAEFRQHGIEIESIKGDYFAVIPDPFDIDDRTSLLPITPISERIAAELDAAEQGRAA